MTHPRKPSRAVKLALLSACVIALCGCGQKCAPIDYPCPAPHSAQEAQTPSTDQHIPPQQPAEAKPENMLGGFGHRKPCVTASCNDAAPKSPLPEASEDAPQ